MYKRQASGEYGARMAVLEPGLTPAG